MKYIVTVLESRRITKVVDSADKDTVIKDAIQDSYQMAVLSCPQIYNSLERVDIESIEVY